MYPTLVVPPWELMKFGFCESGGEFVIPVSLDITFGPVLRVARLVVGVLAEPEAAAPPPLLTVGGE